MFADSFLPNLALFVLGQAAAWFYLRTGRFLIGAVATAALWIAADWAAVARFAFENDTHYHAALFTMQGTAFGITLLLAYQQWRRRWSPASRQRHERFAAGMAAYLRHDHDAARAAFRRLVATDPWDAAAWLALGNAYRRSGDVGATRRCYRRGQRVDKRGEYTELVGQLADRAAPARPAQSSAKAEPKPAPTTSAPTKAAPAKPPETQAEQAKPAPAKPARTEPAPASPTEPKSAVKQPVPGKAPPEQPTPEQPTPEKPTPEKPAAKKRAGVPPAATKASAKRSVAKDRKRRAGKAARPSSDGKSQSA